ncbi:MAG: polysaccharide deacetylase family protein [Akkermansia sp.]|nr:polysaccharide deacetylase family protein [Akkermansia sp.]
MRVKFVKYVTMCAAALLGAISCQQQDQQQTAVVVTPVPAVVKPVPAPATVKPAPATVKPVPAPATVKPIPAKPRPEVVKPQPKEVKPQAPEVVAPVVKPAGAPAVAGLSEELVQPVRLKPLGKRVCHVPMKGMYVALTFDDGPHAVLTPKALDILKKHGAKGTFFMLGSNAARYKSLVARAAAEGHEVGVHTWTHIKMNSSSRAKVDNEVTRTQNLLARATGTYPRVMRPPYGATNKTLVDHMFNHYGMASILWDVDTEDWRKPGVSKVINTAVTKARPGSIILVHDIHATTLDALEGIVTGLQARGFKLVTVSELLALGKQEAEAAAAAAAASEQSEKETTTEAPAPVAPQPEGETEPVTAPEEATLTTQPAMEPSGSGEPETNLETIIVE